MAAPRPAGEGVRQVADEAEDAEIQIAHAVEIHIVAGG